MNRHPARPASIYREPSAVEDSREKVRSFVRAMRAGPGPYMWGRLYRGIAMNRLSRNLFTTKPGDWPEWVEAGYNPRALA